MAAVDDIKSSLDLSQIAQFLGTDEQTADQAVDQALAQLVGSMDGKADDADAAVGLGRAALGDHVGSSAYGDRIDINAVDEADGQKIVSHVLSPDQMQTLSSGAGGQLLRKLLPILAPIVMGYIASKLQERMGGAAGRSQQPGGQHGGGLGDILGDLLGGGSARAPQQPETQPPAPQPPSSGGGFRVPTGDGGGLRMDTGAAAGGPTPQQPSQAPAGGGVGDVLGGLLKEILLGRR